MWKTWISVALVVFLSSWTVVAAETTHDPGTVSGGPVRAPWDFAQPVAPAIDAEYDDIGGTPSPWAEAVLPRTTPEMSEAANVSTKGSTAGAPTTASMVLAGLDRTSRLNAMIELEPLNTAAEGSSTYTAEAASLWNQGSFDLALTKIEQLEATGARFAVGITWREPIGGPEPEIYVDARVGGTSIDAEDISLDYHRGTGNIFIAVSWGPNNPNSTKHWTVNMSTTGGAIWAETFSYYGGTGAESPLIDMTVVDDLVYVSYVNPPEPSVARTRRFFASTGASDTTYNFHSVDDVSPATVVDISTCGNPDTFDDRIYLAFIDSNNNLKFFWDVASDGKTFSEMSPSVSAEGGIDMHFNQNYTDNFLYVSYIGTDGGVHVLRRSSISWIDYVIEATFTGSPTRPRARISASNDEIYVIYDHEYTYGRGVKYKVSYTDGGTWASGNLYEPADGEPGGQKPDVSNRSGWHTAVIWNREEGVDNAYHVDRPVGTSWSDPFPFSNFDVYSGSENFIQYIGSLCVKGYGMVYFADDQIPYFDLMDYRAFFCDGFESGGTTGWD